MIAVTTPEESLGNIRVERQPVCILCGTEGTFLYQGLGDRIYGAPGAWSFRRCANQDCRHVWLDPRPVESDLHLVYEDYFTHEPEPPAKRAGLGGKGGQSLLIRALRLAHTVFHWLIGLPPRQRRLYEMYVGGHQPGRLLEIGAGSGERLAHFAAKGWDVVGQDVDPLAVSNARAVYGLPMHLGPIETLPNSIGLFDAVIMNHVIEHVANPVDLIRQAASHLAPGGTLVAVTPNVESIGHRYFKESWFPLQPPQHLHLFSNHTMKALAKHAGLKTFRVTTSAVSGEGYSIGSLNIADTGKHDINSEPSLGNRAKGAIFLIAALIINMVKPASGEECILIAECETVQNSIANPSSASAI